MSTFTPLDEEIEFNVRTRNAEKWQPLYDAVCEYPGVWLAVPEDVADEVRKSGRFSVRAKLRKSGQGGDVVIGKSKDGATAIRWIPAPLAEKAETSSEVKANKKSSK